MKITEILETHGIETRQHGDHHHVSSGWLGLDCPWCSPNTKRFRMGYNNRTNAITCYSCGPQRLVPTLQQLTGLPVGKCIELVGGLDFDRVREYKHTGKLELPKGLGPLLPTHRKYLEGRKFDPDALERLWRIQGIGNAARHAWSIFIPIYHMGQVVSWTTRVCREGKKAKYVNARPEQEKVPAKSLLYGEDMVRHTICVVEGPTGVWRIGPGACCTFGLGFSREQVVRIARYPRVVVCFDSEPLAQRRADALCDSLSALGSTVDRVVLDSLDPGMATKREIGALRAILGA